MKVLVACEESQEVCKAFREKGHEAYSADLQDCSGGHPEWHYMGDVIPLLNGNVCFITRGGVMVDIIGHWDLIIAHPPCTYLCVSGNRWFDFEKYGKEAYQRWRNRVKAAIFFMRIAGAECNRIAIENPIGIMSSMYRKADQIIQPYEFGHKAKKSTCLWLKGLPKLEPTEIVEPDLVQYRCSSGKIATFSADYGVGYGKSGKRRSKTYSGIGKAMAEQWGKE